MDQLFTYKDILPSNTVKPNSLTAGFGRKTMTEIACKDYSS